MLSIWTYLAAAAAAAARRLKWPHRCAEALARTWGSVLDATIQTSMARTRVDGGEGTDAGANDWAMRRSRRHIVLMQGVWHHRIAVLLWALANNAGPFTGSPSTTPLMISTGWIKKGYKSHSYIPRDTLLVTITYLLTYLQHDNLPVIESVSLISL